MGQFQKGHASSNTGKTWFKKGHTPWLKGTKGLIKSWNKGTKGVCKSNSGSFKKGQRAWNKGIKGVLKSCWKGKKRLGFNAWQYRKDKLKWSGENSPNWKNGISPLYRLIRQMSEYKKWRAEVFTRDNWTCRTCQKNECYVTAHHIKSIRQIIIDNNLKNIIDARNCNELWDIQNGITLCEECHSHTDNYKRRAIKKYVC